MVYTASTTPKIVRANLGISDISLNIGIGAFSEFFPVAGGNNSHPPLDTLKDYHCWFRTTITISKTHKVSYPKKPINPAESIRRDIWAPELFSTDQEMLDEFKRAFELQSIQFGKKFDNWYMLSRILKSYERNNIWVYGKFSG